MENVNVNDEKIKNLEEKNRELEEKNRELEESHKKLKEKYDILMNAVKIYAKQIITLDKEEDLEYRAILNSLKGVKNSFVGNTLVGGKSYGHPDTMEQANNGFKQQKETGIKSTASQGTASRHLHHGSVSVDVSATKMNDTTTIITTLKTNDSESRTTSINNSTDPVSTIVSKEFNSLVSKLRTNGILPTLDSTLDSKLDTTLNAVDGIKALAKFCSLSRS